MFSFLAAFLLLFFVFVVIGRSEGFQTEHAVVTSVRSSSSSSSSSTFLSYSKEDEDDPLLQNTNAKNTSATTSRRVFVNPNYIPPVIPIRVQTKNNDKRTMKATRMTLPGGEDWLEIGHQLRKAAAATTTTTTTQTLLLQAGDSITEIGRNWQDSATDWEAVTYSALDASLTMKLVAQSLNHQYETNDLQQALAGVAVELKVLSNTEHSRTSRNLDVSCCLQGLALRLYQASESSIGMNDRHTRKCFQEAANAAKSLAKQQQQEDSSCNTHAIFNHLPHHFQQWWHQKEHVQRVSMMKDDDEDLLPFQ